VKILTLLLLLFSHDWLYDCTIDEYKFEISKLLSHFDQYGSFMFYFGANYKEII